MQKLHDTERFYLTVGVELNHIDVSSNISPSKMIIDEKFDSLVHDMSYRCYSVQHLHEILRKVHLDISGFNILSYTQDMSNPVTF